MPGSPQPASSGQPFRLRSGCRLALSRPKIWRACVEPGDSWSLRGRGVSRAPTPLAISEAEPLAPTEGLYERIEEHESVIGQFWVREDRP
jgi:hypothetical protein